MGDHPFITLFTFINGKVMFNYMMPLEMDEHPYTSGAY